MFALGGGLFVLFNRVLLDIEGLSSGISLSLSVRIDGTTLEIPVTPVSGEAIVVTLLSAVSFCVSASYAGVVLFNRVLLDIEGLSSGISLSLSVRIDGTTLEIPVTPVSGEAIVVTLLSAVSFCVSASYAGVFVGVSINSGGRI